MNISDQLHAALLDETSMGFKKLRAKLAARKGVKDPDALAAWIGRRKYGAAKMKKMAVAGRRKG